MHYFLALQHLELLLRYLVSNCMNKTISIGIALVCVVGIGIILFGKFENTTQSSEIVSGSNVEIRDGVQYVTITARGGYFPKNSVAEAGIPTTLIVKTNNTYDCSSALVIRSLGYQNMLSPSGEEVIEVGVPTTGKLQGLCSMGMYSFAIDFQ